MRKLIYYISVSLEGYYKTFDGNVPEEFVPSEAEHQYANDLLLDVDAIVCGRGMYDVMSYWDTVDLADVSMPRVEREFAERYQRTPRHIFSTTLATADDRATLHRGDAVARVSELKAQDGTCLLLGCGSALLAELLQAGVVDEIRLLVVPVILGEGVPLFANMQRPAALTLIASEAYASGSVLLSYAVK